MYMINMLCYDQMEIFILSITFTFPPKHPDYDVRAKENQPETEGPLRGFLEH